jgi:septal ring factor EnvC (AmiA/AmiB activator)
MRLNTATLLVMFVLFSAQVQAQDKSPADQLKDVKAKISQMEQQNQKLKSDISDKEQQISDLKAQISKLDTQIADLKKKLGQGQKNGPAEGGSATSSGQ